MSLRNEIPLLNALAVFETAARRSSFTTAAKELGIAQSAVSRHVSNLENYFRLQLFDRYGKRIELTPGGKRLADAVSIGLGHIRVVLTELRRETQSDTLTIGCSYDFAYLWLMPRFGLIREVLKGREVKVVAAASYAEFEGGGVDLSVRFGQTTDWPDATCVRLFAEEVFPVCAPSLLAARPELADGDIHALRGAPLLFADQRGLTWRDWFAQAGVPPPEMRGPIFSNYIAVLYEAVAGRGVALGWRHLVGDLVERDALRVLDGRVLHSDSAFFAVHRSAPDSEIDRLAQWFASAAALSAPQPILIGPPPRGPKTPDDAEKA